MTTGKNSEDSITREFKALYPGLRAIAGRYFFYKDDLYTDDAVMDVFVKYIEITSGGDQIIDDPAKWFRKAVARRSIDYLRKMKSWKNRDESYQDLQLDEQTSELFSDIHQLKEQQFVKLHEYVDQLEEHLRRYIVLHYFQGMTNSKIVELLGVEDRKPRDWNYQAKKILKRFFDENK